MKISHTELTTLKGYRILLLFFLYSATFFSDVQAQVKWKNVKVLVYTRNGKGYVHDNIPAAVSCITELGKRHGFSVTVADTPIVFTDENLKQYR